MNANGAVDITILGAAPVALSRDACRRPSRLRLRVALLLAATAIFGALLLAARSAGQKTTEGRCGAGRLTGDVTGDRVKDVVTLRGAWTTRGCRYWLGVSANGVPHSLRLHEGLLEAPRVSPQARIATLFGLARIDSRQGAEVLVTLDRSASGEGVGVYRWRRGRLHYMPLAGKNRVEGIFWHNQSGLGGDRVDCWKREASGNVITLSFELNPPGAGATVHRRLWRVEGAGFRRVWARNYLHTRRTFAEERTSMPFEHCLTRR